MSPKLDPNDFFIIDADWNTKTKFKKIPGKKKFLGCGQMSSTGQASFVNQKL